MCLQSGVFTLAQFRHYFGVWRIGAQRFVQTLIDRRVAVESDHLMFNGGGLDVPDIEQRDLPGAWS